MGNAVSEQELPAAESEEDYTYDHRHRRRYSSRRRDDFSQYSKSAAQSEYSGATSHPSDSQSSYYHDDVTAAAETAATSYYTDGDGDDVTAHTEMAHHGRSKRAGSEGKSSQQTETDDSYDYEVRAGTSRRDLLPPKHRSRSSSPDQRRHHSRTPSRPRVFPSHHHGDVEVIELLDVDERDFDSPRTRAEKLLAKDDISVELNPKRLADDLKDVKTAVPVETNPFRQAKTDHTLETARSYLDPGRSKQSETHTVSTKPSAAKTPSQQESIPKDYSGQPSLTKATSEKTAEESLQKVASVEVDTSTIGDQSKVSRVTVDDAYREQLKKQREARQEESEESSFGTKETRDPEESGTADCDQTVERSRHKPEEKMARTILNARIKQALRHGDSIDDDDDALTTTGSLLSLQSLKKPSAQSPSSADEVAAVLSDVEDFDISFVQQYELAFELFIKQNISLMARNPELIYNLRVAKLQKLLQVTNDIETELVATIEKRKQEKTQMVTEYQQKLVEAARRKAALEIHLRQELGTIQQATLEMQGKLMWQVISKNDTRAKRHYKLLQMLSREKGDPHNLLMTLPHQTGTQSIREAAAAPATDELTAEQERDLRQFQVENSYLNSEVNVLEKKLAYAQALSKKYAWVDSLFIRMEPRHMNKLKSRYQKKLGVKF